MFVVERMRHVFEQYMTNDWLMDRITYHRMSSACMWVSDINKRKSLVEILTKKIIKTIRKFIWLAVILMRCQNNNIHAEMTNESTNFHLFVIWSMEMYIDSYFISTMQRNPNWIDLHNIVSYFDSIGLIVNLRHIFYILMNTKRKIEMHSFIILICCRLSETNKSYT